MRTLLFASLASLASLAACAPPSHGPAWPRTADRNADGGESIAPRPSSASVTSSATDDDADDTAVVAKPAAAKDVATPEAAKPTITPAAPAAGDDTLFIDDVTIEIED